MYIKLTVKIAKIYWLNRKIIRDKIEQHKYSVKTAQNSSALFVHLRDKEHCIDWSSSSIAFSKSYMNKNVTELAL